MNKDRFEELEQLENGTSSNKVIELKSVFKGGKHIVQPAFNSKTAWYEGVARLSDEEKKGLSYYVRVGETGSDARHNTKLKLENGTIFDLNNEIDKINWSWVKHLPCIAVDFEEAQQSKAEFYVHVDGREAEKKNKSRKTKVDAMQMVLNDSPVNYANRALLLGMDMEGESPAVIQEFLLDTAENKPEEIERVYRGKDMKIKLLFVQAKRKGTIEVNEADGVVKFGRTILGYSDDSAVAYLRENTDLLELVERDVNPDYFEEKQSKRKPEIETPIDKALRVKKEIQTIADDENISFDEAKKIHESNK